MKLHDYIWCFVFADFISASIIHLNLSFLLIGLFGYYMYEKFTILRSERK